MKSTLAAFKLYPKTAHVLSKQLVLSLELEV